MKTQEKFIGPYKKYSVKDLDQIIELNYSLGFDCVRFRKKLQNNTQVVHLKGQATFCEFNVK